MTEQEVVDYVNMQDVYQEEYKIFYIAEFGKIEPLKELGWQPMCLIQLVNEAGEIRVSGYGEDH